MKRRPLPAAPAPAYPDRVRARSVALGLLALGAATVASAPAIGCGDMRPPADHGQQAVLGDMVEPQPSSTAPVEGEQQGEATPMAMPGEAPKQPPCLIPEATEVGEQPTTHEPRIAGGMRMPDPHPVEAQPETIPEASPETAVGGDMPAVDGDMPDIEGDLVVPEPEPGVGPEDHPPIPGGMPAPQHPQPVPTPPPEADDAE
jgi:hypothetical protein